MKKDLFVELSDEELARVSGGKEEVRSIYPPDEEGSVVIINDLVTDDSK